MFWTVKWWVVIFVTAMFLSFIGIPFTAVAYYVLDVFGILFLFCSLGRMSCIANYVLTGVEVRARDEISFLPSGVSPGIFQRLYVATGLIIREAGMSIIASWSMLVLSSGRAAAWPLAVNMAATDTLAVLSALGLLCMLIRLVLIHCHTLGWLTIYDPGERLHRNRPIPETDAQPPAAPVVMRILMLTRRAAAAWLILLAFMGALFLSGRNWFLLWIPEFDKWSLYVSLGVGAVIGLHTLARFIIIALAFARYSIVHVLGMQLLIGLLVSLTMNLPRGWSALAFMVTLVLVFMCFYYIALQDPDGERYVPEFIRAQRRARRRERRVEEQKKKERDKPERLTHESAAARSSTPPLPLPKVN
jgi:hypothetical protein